MRFLIIVSFAYSVIACHIIHQLSSIALPDFLLYQLSGIALPDFLLYKI